MARPRRRRGGRLRSTGLLVILAVLAAVSAAAWLVFHLLILAGLAVIVGGAFYGGRLTERRKAGRFPAPIAAPPAAGWQPTPAADPRGDQIRDLEDAAGRPIEAIISSYRLIQQKYGART